MPEPFGTSFDHSLATEPLPEDWETAAHEGADVLLPDESKIHRADGGQAVDPAADGTAGYFDESSPHDYSQSEQPLETWVAPADPPFAPPGETPSAENSDFPESVFVPYAEIVDADPLPAEPAADLPEWQDEAPEQNSEEVLEESSPFSPGRRPLYKRSEPPPTAEAQLSNVIAFLQTLQAGIRKVEPGSEAQSAADLGLSILQLKRLSRTGVTPDHFQIGVLPKAPTAPSVEVDPVAELFTEQPVARREIPPESAPLHLEHRQVVWLILTGALSLVTLCLVAYLWMRIGPSARTNAVATNPTERKKSTSAIEGIPISDEALKIVNVTLEAIQRNDLKKAANVLANAQKQGMKLLGLYYQSALLAFSRGQVAEANDFLNRSIAANEAVAECHYLRANSAFSMEGPANAAEEFEQAIAAAPFSPRYYFFRAECLRRNGNTVTAIGQFQQALRCRPGSADTELILFKIGLAKIESNTDLIFKTELRDRLSHEPVAGDPLLLAAAEAINRSEYVEAADDLKRAALDLPPRVF